MLRAAKTAVLRAANLAGYEIVKRGAAPMAPPPIPAPAPPPPIDPILSVRRSPDEFREAMSEYEQKFPVRKNGNEIVDALEKDGLCIVPDFLPSDRVRAIHDEALAVAKTIHGGTFTGPNRITDFRDQGFLRLNSPENAAPLTAALFEDSRIKEVAQAYLSGHARRMEKYVDYKYANLFDGALHPHCDNIYRMLKVFFYLNDIPETHAPFTMWKRSQLKRSWRELPDYLYFSDHPHGWGHIPEGVHSGFGKGDNADIVKVTCTAKAGTAIFCDVSGMHAASLLRDGYRLMLVDCWFTFDQTWLSPYHSKATGPNGYL